ncbi:MAG TPA: hypothetical protein VL092_13580, partial [Chitinophagaceae bacterium]|nr:hypothetical protein [Chitinophagaceae bacterium]
MKGAVTTMFLLLNVYCLSAQSIKGKLFGVTDEGKEILPGAIVRFIGSAGVVSVQQNGVFELPLAGISDRRIIATETGYETDTIDPGDKTYLSITLRRSALELRAVTVQDQRAAYISNGVLKTEVINQKELSKAACCDLAGCFGTQASVQAQTTNVVTNAQELRILGLSGVYNQVLFDGLPMVQGLSYTYG